MQVHMHKDGMNLRKLLLVIVGILLVIHSFNFFSPSTICRADTPPTLYVGRGENYLSIQDALNNAADGYRIFVYNGTYYENLVINHRIDLFGEDRSITIINGNRINTVITVNANNVNISHFTITNGSSTEGTSVIEVNGDNSIITDNIISNGYHGIHLDSSDNHLVYDNIICNNSGDGIRLYRSYNNVNISYNTITDNRNGLYLYASDGNNIYNNEMQNNYQSGIFLNSSCQYNTIRNNNASQNTKHGIYLNDYSDYQAISYNQIFYNKNSGLVLENCSMNFEINGNMVIGNVNYGMMIVGSMNNISNNIISSNKKDGLYLSADDNNMVYKNILSYNTMTGIRLYNSTYDYIRNNEICHNTECGAYLDFFTINNVIYNNYFHDNTRNAMDKSINRNKWNITKINRINVIQGTSLCGNYWDDYDESAEGAIDVDIDGVADNPYTIYAINSDKGPLLDTVKPQIGIPSSLPVSQALGKYTNLSVLITDNTKITAAFVNITGPDGQYYNVSITENKTGNIYSYYRKFSTTGNYTFHIIAKDPRNWNSSINQNFSVRPGEKPMIKDNSPTTGKPSKKFTFNATVSSKDALASDLEVSVVWNHASVGNNSTMAISRGNYFVTTVTLGHSIGNLTYHYCATDKWGNSAVSETKKIKILDTEPPEIYINHYGYSYENLPNSYTIGATITDDSLVSIVTLEYWYNGSSIMTARMESTGSNYYKKVIILDESPSRLFCVINATDVAGNSKDTRNPIAHHGGPYSGFVLQNMKLNGSRSVDLDGTITNYTWDFGDGTTGVGDIVYHTYFSSGTYTIKLTVTDEQGRNGTNQTTVTILPFTQHTIPLDQLDLINIRYNLDLTEQFFCYDSDGDGVFDIFVDPANELSAVHENSVNFNGNILFLVSIGADFVPEFFWDTTNDVILPIVHTIGVVQNKVVDDENEQAKLYVTVQKEQWIYIEIDDQYPDATVIITTAGRTISADKIWRINQKIYVFDDPEMYYEFMFYNIYPPVSAIFSPNDGGLINSEHTTIKITYNVPVTIITATFDTFNVQSQLVRLDERNYMYTPPGYLENGTYSFDIHAQAIMGKGFLSSSVVYFYFSYEAPPQKSFLEQYGLWIMIGVLIGTLGGLLLLFKVKNITIDGFIYLRNRKIIPFFKSVIFGPVSVQIPHEHLSKAEFYVDGTLKDEITSFPVFWQWNEKAFLKHTLETRVYDNDGNSTSSGEMEFYIFNLSKGK